MQDHVNIKLVSIVFLYKKNSRSLEFASKMNNKKLLFYTVLILIKMQEKWYPQHVCMQY